MNYTQEKFLLGIATLASSSVSALGAMFSENEALKYIYMTMSVSIITAAFMALVFRKQTETMKVVVGRCGLAILMGVFGTRILTYHFNIVAAKADIIYLMGLAGGVTIAGFLVGVVFLRIVDRRSSDIANSLFTKVFKPDGSDKKE